MVIRVINMNCIIYNENDNLITLAYEGLKSTECLHLSPVPNEEHHFWDLYGWLVKVFGL
jgi:hypothetical protein